MKKIFSALAGTALAFMCISLCACNSDTTENPDTPREFVGIFKYTGATYAPAHINAPYFYAIYDINGGFISYVDTTRFITPNISMFINKPVVAKGTIMKLDGESVLRVKSIRFLRE